MLASLEAAASRRASSWGNQEELLASLLEVTHALLVSFLTANTKPKDRWRIPEPLRVTRPNAPVKKRRSWFEVLASMPGGRR